MTDRCAACDSYVCATSLLSITTALSAAEVAVNVATKRKRAWLPAASLTLAAGAQSYVFVDALRPVVVYNVVPGSAAYTAGVRPGDHVLKLESRPYTQVETAAANAAFMQGSRGQYELSANEKVNMLVWSPAATAAAGTDSAAVATDTASAASESAQKPRDLSIAPKPMDRVTVEFRRIGSSSSSSSVGYIRISGFSRLTGNEVEEALAELLRQGAKSILLDLRGNLGGSIGAGADIPSLFLPANTPVMSMENAQGKIETLASVLIASAMPLVSCFTVLCSVLVEQYCSSN
eukprot:16994-Heterococcus_DN1.PRE.2